MHDCPPAPAASHNSEARHPFTRRYGTNDFDVDRLAAVLQQILELAPNSDLLVPPTRVMDVVEAN